MVMKMELLCRKCRSVAPSALEKSLCTETQKGEMVVTAVLFWSFSPEFGVGRWQCSVESALKDRLELPRNEEQGNVEVSLLDFCFKKKNL